MSLRTAQDCACRVIDDRRKDSSRSSRPLVIVTANRDLKEVRKMVSASMPPGSECFGAVWRSPEGEVVSVRAYEEKVPPFQDGFEVAVCNGGQEYSADERKHVDRWRKAAS